MRIKGIMLSGMLLLALALAITTGAAQSDNNASDNLEELFDDIEDYQGPIGPDNALYGLKIAFEDLGEGFTFNERERLLKQIEHAEQRIAEAKAKLNEDKTEDAEKALERYREKIKEVNNLIAGYTVNDSGILNAQRMVVKHQFVLEQLLESHPNNTGLERAYNNSLELEDRFESKTERKLERIETRGRDRIKIREIEREKIEIKAAILNNASEVKIEVRFVSNNTDRDAIAQEILDKLDLSTENISSLLKFEVEEEQLRTSSELTVKASVERGVTDVETEFRFPLNTSNRTDIIEGISDELSGLIKEDILGALELKVRERIGKAEREDLEIKAKVTGNSTEVKVEVKFLSDTTEPGDIAQDIRNKFNLTRDDISSILEIEVEDEDELKTREEMKVEVDVEKSVAEVKFELQFLLNTSDRAEIVDKVYEKLSTLTINTSEIRVKKERKEIKEREEEREVKEERKEVKERKEEREVKEEQKEIKEREEERETKEERNETQEQNKSGNARRED